MCGDVCDGQGPSAIRGMSNVWAQPSLSGELGSRKRRHRDAQANARLHKSMTHTQVPGVQLHLLLQLRQELVVEGLELQAERKDMVPWGGLTNPARGAPGRQGRRCHPGKT